MQYTQEMWIQSLGQEDPLKEETATCSSVVARIIPWTEEPGGLQSMGLQRIRHDWAIEHTHMPRQWKLRVLTTGPPGNFWGFGGVFCLFFKVILAKGDQGVKAGCDRVGIEQKGAAVGPAYGRGSHTWWETQTGQVSEEGDSVDDRSFWPGWPGGWHCH